MDECEALVVGCSSGRRREKGRVRIRGRRGQVCAAVGRRWGAVQVEAHVETRLTLLGFNAWNYNVINCLFKRCVQLQHAPLHTGVVPKSAGVFEVKKRGILPYALKSTAQVVRLSCRPHTAVVGGL